MKYYLPLILVIFAGCVCEKNVLIRAEAISNFESQIFTNTSLKKRGDFYIFTFHTSETNKDFNIVIKDSNVIDKHHITYDSIFDSSLAIISRIQNISKDSLLNKCKLSISIYERNSCYRIIGKEQYVLYFLDSKNVIIYCKERRIIELLKAKSYLKSYHILLPDYYYGRLKYKSE
jgi:hypothetical protein